MLFDFKPIVIEEAGNPLSEATKSGETV